MVTPVSHSTATLDHQIILAYDKHTSAQFLTELLGLEPPEAQSIFMAVRLGNQVTLLFKTVNTDIAGHHYAFRVSKAEFPVILKRAQTMGIRYWGTPKGENIGHTYELNGETGFYFHDPSGHQFEVLTDAD